jgi:hypothetical protein
MNVSEIQIKLTEEISLVPHDRLSELYNFIHFYRLGLEIIPNNTEEIMKFAGCWQDMPDEEFEDFLKEIAERRQQAFSRRREYETFND